MLLLLSLDGVPVFPLSNPKTNQPTATSAIRLILAATR